MSVGLISREEAFELNPVLANAVIRWQQAEYNDVKNNLDAEDLQWFKQRLDNFSNADPVIKYRSEILLASQESTLEYFLLAFQAFLTKLKVNELIFIPVFKDSWLKQRHNYPPVKNALKYIESAVIDKNYFEGIVAGAEDIKRMFTSVFWLSRCCASMCGIYFSPPDGSIVFSLCRYGVLHLTSYDENGRDNLNLCLPGTGLKQIDKCSDIFSETAITGRQIIV